ncbi:hypothetical protein RvY_09013 [Ramazzottius varieornatus]|uniref:DNA-(apurinic or apyrimidinic site) endonuclease n=1 Tax=Ramazzottius varieornatus TaxID=947166 RepID=A0A1D1VDH2_RAMVA|nr:hypothetical protein RvY_09013 [Ramazzottius varieornatus]
MEADPPSSSNETLTVSSIEASLDLDVPSSSPTAALPIDGSSINTTRRSDRRQTILPGTILALRKLSGVTERTNTTPEASPPPSEVSASEETGLLTKEPTDESPPLSQIQEESTGQSLPEPNSSAGDVGPLSGEGNQGTNWSRSGRLRAKQKVVYAQVQTRHSRKGKRSEDTELGGAPLPKILKLKDNSEAPKGILKKPSDETEAALSKSSRHLAFPDESAFTRQELAETRKVEVESSPAVLPNPPPKVALLPGKTPSLQILSYNIGGLSTFLPKNTWVEINALLPDVVCLQETKTEGEELLQLGVNVGTTYAYWYHGKSKNEAGVAILSKNKPLNVLYGFSRSNGEEFASMGHVITAEYPAFYIVNTYVPSSSTNLKNLQDRLLWEEDLRKFLTSLQEKKPVIVAGDLNVAVQDMDIYKPSVRKVPGSSVEERNSINTTLSSVNLVDVYRTLNPAVEQCYTWFAPRSTKKTASAWRLDYFLISKAILPQVCGIHHFANIVGSTHIPLMLYLEVV